jgi:hypothetical protein
LVAVCLFVHLCDKLLNVIEGATARRDAQQIQTAFKEPFDGLHKLFAVSG